jgi:hypothetical protein
MNRPIHFFQRLSFEKKAQCTLLAQSFIGNYFSYNSFFYVLIHRNSEAVAAWVGTGLIPAPNANEPWHPQCDTGFIMYSLPLKEYLIFSILLELQKFL